MPVRSPVRGAHVNLVARAAALELELELAVLVVVTLLGPQVREAFSLFAAVEAILMTLSSGFGLAAGTARAAVVLALHSFVTLVGVALARMACRMI